MPGDGTYALTRGDNAIELFDIAGGSWGDVRNDHRIEYHVARDAAGYREALNRLPAFLDRVRPALVQYQAGMDPFEDDPVGGIDGITEAFLIERDRFVVAQVRGRGIPLVVNLAGGYVHGVSERLHVNTIIGHASPPVSDPEPCPLGMRWAAWKIYVFMRGASGGEHLTPAERVAVRRARRRRLSW